MTFAELLAARGITRALIVDDAGDPIPTAADMRSAAGEWAIFNDDLEKRHRDIIAERYPVSLERRFDELIGDDCYVAAVWALRHELDGLADPLFEIYDANQAADSRYVANARERLEALGLAVETRGRAFADECLVADLIVVDLYFGGGQDDTALADSKKLLAKAIRPRASNPPLVVLMSRSENLEAKRDEFRDEVGLVDSGFRILRKSDLDAGDRLERQIERLALNAVETRRLARFFTALDEGIAEAAARTLKLMRRLKLSDVGQIQQLLLDVEGEPTGSYLVDVFDRVLQNEIEAQAGIIDAANELNAFSIALHPPPYVAGSPDLQELVERMLTQNAGRLALPGSSDGLVTFGDLLQASPPVDGAAGPALPVDLPQNGVLLVLTPACDLQRGGAPRILLLVGTAKPLTAWDWRYGTDARTAAVRIGGELHWIKWNLKHVDTVSWVQLEAWLKAGAVNVFARLREAHALEIQQRVLAGLGRVGLVAPMPATFAVEIEAYYASVSGVPTRLEVAALNDGAVCFVGREANGDRNLRLVLTEGGCDGLESALVNLDPALVAPQAHTALEHIKLSGDLRRILSSGLSLKGVGADAWTFIASETGGTAVQKMGLIGWNLPGLTAPLSSKQLNKAGVILLMRDIATEGAVGLTEAIRSGALKPSHDGAGADEDPAV